MKGFFTAMKVDSIIERKAMLVSVNILFLLSVFSIQQSTYDDMLTLDTSATEFGEVELAGRLMQHYGEDMNVLAIVCVFLLVQNVVVSKYWVKSKRWIIEPIVVFFISFLVTIGFHVIRGKEVGKEIKTTNHNTRD